MAHSVELRVPLVDPWLHARVAAAGFEPARSFGKAAVARAVTAEIPAEALERKKSGFYVPLAEALGGGRTASHGTGARRLALQLLSELGLPDRALGATSATKDLDAAARPAGSDR
jgi:hypothetical protein